MRQLAEEIIQGRRLNRQDDLTVLLQADLEQLCAGADWIRRTLCGSDYELCTIINARSGRCGEDCKFCAQSCRHRTPAQEYPFLEVDEIVQKGKQDEAAGVQRYSLVTAGRAVDGAELDRALDAFRILKEETGLGLCASFGFQTVEDFRRLKEAGVTRCHANLETSRRNFPNICTTHTYQDKIDNIRRARQAGLQICSGGILGMGESWEDRLEMALDLAELEADSIPLNLLTPIPGTPLEDTPPLSEADARRSVAIFRYINPTAWIRMAAGRGRFPEAGAVFFRSGANSAITGDMLTTAGTQIAQDVALMKQGGFFNGNKT